MTGLSRYQVPIPSSNIIVTFHFSHTTTMGWLSVAPLCILLTLVNNGGADTANNTTAAPTPEANFFGGQDGFNSQDAGYIILCCYVVFTMQSGFALLESGTIFQNIICSLPGTLLRANKGISLPPLLYRESTLYQKRNHSS